MAAKVSNSSSSSMVQFVLDEYWTFSEAAFNLAKTISSIKRVRRDFAPFSDCLKQAKALMFKKSMTETDNFLSQGHLNGYDIQTQDGYNHTVHYTTGRFGKDTLQKLYTVPELPVLHNSTRLTLLIMREAHCGADGTNQRKSPSEKLGELGSVL